MNTPTLSTRTTLLTLLTAGLLGGIGVNPLQAQHKPKLELRLAPMNPAYIEWENKQKERNERIAQGLPVDEIPDSNIVPIPYTLPPFHGPATQIERMVNAGLASFPAQYDLRDENGVTPVRNQGNNGTCWTFANIGSLESNILRTTGVPIDLSEWHLAYFLFTPWKGMPAFPVKQPDKSIFDQGAHSNLAIAVLTRGTGPVAEALAPYNGPIPTENVSNVATVKSAYTLAEPTRDNIKGLISTYGAMYISLAADSSLTNDYTKYNPTYHAYRNMDKRPTVVHAVCIIGWNDNFPKTNFPTGNQPSENGAWLCRNSWGTKYHDQGYFWMSYDTADRNYYYDSSNDFRVSYEGSLSVDKNIYQYDLLGKQNSGYLFNEGISPVAWFSNVFTAVGDTITDVAFYTSAQNADYEITIRTGVTTHPNTGILVFGPMKGTNELPGYHRIKLTSPVNITPGEKFAVIIKNTEYTYSTDGTQLPGKPISLCKPINPLPSGSSFYSINGIDWEDSNYYIDPWDGTEYFTNSWNPIVKAFETMSNSVIITNAPGAMFPNDTITCQANVIGVNDQTVNWTASSGTIDSQGKYTAPTVSQTQNVIITATSRNNPSITGTAQVRINANSLANFDGNSSKNPQFLGLSKAYTSRTQTDVNKYDLNNNAIVDDGDTSMLFKVMGW